MNIWKGEMTRWTDVEVQLEAVTFYSLVPRHRNEEQSRGLVHLSLVHVVLPPSSLSNPCPVVSRAVEFPKPSTPQIPPVPWLGTPFPIAALPQA